MSKMKNNKTPIDNNLVIKAVKKNKTNFVETTIKLFNKCFIESTTLEA